MVTKKVIPIKQITSWSFSRYSLYKKCPAAANFKFNLGLKEPGSAAMQRGTDIHKLAEDYTKGLLKKLPVELSLFKDEFAELKKQKAKNVEDSWTFKADWSLTTWNDWNGAWLRVKLDVGYLNTDHNVYVPIDHKTGKFREEKNAEYAEQLELYGLAALKMFPNIDATSPRLWYLDEGVIYPDPAVEEIVYERKDEAYLEKLWQNKIKKMMSDKTFKPTPGSACTYCHYRKSNNGPCKF
jgi:CRISPR/Cas system-associated exonuclease Cas4 (RecB family)